MSTRSPEERVLICAPVGQDALAMGSILAKDGFLPEVCLTLEECGQKILEGAGVLLFTVEAFQQHEVPRLLKILERQPPWSELPIVILSSGEEAQQAEVLRLFSSTGRGVTLLERPMHRAVLLSSVQVALHSRRRQYQVRDLLRDQRERTNRQQALYQLVDCLNRAESLVEIYDVALDAIMAATHCDRASILLFDDSGVMRFKAWRGLSSEYRKATEGHSPWKRNHVEPKPICLDNLESASFEEPLRTAIRKEGIGALSFFPLLHQRKLLGKFMVYYNVPRVLAAEELQAAQSIASQLGIGIARKQTEEALARSEQQLRLITDATPALICYLDAQSRYRFVNHQHETWVGRPREQYLGATMTEVLGEETAARLRPYVDRALAGHAVDFEIQLPHRDGGLRWVENHYIPHRNGADSAVGFYVLVLDITHRKEAEQALLLARKRYAALVTTMTSIVWISDPAGEFVAPQPLWEEFTGQSWEAYRGLGWVDAVHPEDRERVKETWVHACEARTLYRASGRLWHAPSQDYRSFEAQAVPLLDAEGSVCEWVGCVTDVHARKSAELELAHAQTELKEHALHLEHTVAERTARLTEALGELESWSYSIVHDMRAPLRSMQGFSQLLRESYGGRLDSTADNYLRRIATSAERLDCLIQDVLNYSKVVRGDWPIGEVDPQRLIEEILVTYPNLQAPHADIQIQGLLPKVLANQAGLTQVVSNLLGNAVKFVKPGISPRVRIRAEQKEGWVRLWFEDNGIGIEQESLSRIFQMFQRLNRSELYEGTGMGLAIVSKAVERMGGRVGVESEPNQGSRFWVQLKGVALSERSVR